MTGITGLQDGFETPLHPDAVIPTHEMTVEEADEFLCAVAAGC
jgi:adenylylsulfate kinase-like enzyme